MSQSSSKAANGPAHELHLTRVFHAPRALVWKAWTDPKMVALWWGPRMFDTPLCEVDARKGGLINIHMRGPDGNIYPMKGIFTEVAEPERLSFTSYALLSVDADPILETRNTVTLSEEGGKTVLRVDIVVVKATAEATFALAGMEQGWNEQLDRLGETVDAPIGGNEMKSDVRSQKITPFLWFDSEAEEAARFYTSVFENSRIRRIARYGEAGREVHGGEPGSVMTVEFELAGQRFTALNGGPVFKPNEAISFVIDCADQREVDHYWSKLSEGGDERAQQCGWLKDRYGISWQVVPRALVKMLADEDPEKAARVTNALLAMKKIDIEALKRAYEGRP